MSLALGVLAPWLVKILAPSSSAFYRADEAVGAARVRRDARTPATPCSRSASAAHAGRSSTGSSAASPRSLNIALNFALIPPYGMMGAAVATAAAYVALFIGMTINAQHVYPVPYQWRRVLTLSSVAIALTVDRLRAPARSPLAIALCLVYPLLLLPLGFYLPAERARLRRLVPLGS